MQSKSFVFAMYLKKQSDHCQTVTIFECLIKATVFGIPVDKVDLRYSK